MLWLAVLLAPMLGCSPHKVYRSPHKVAVDTSVADLRDDLDGTHRQAVESHCVEEHSEFSLGFVEFDDNGEFWDAAQVSAVEQMIRTEAELADDSGVLIVVFAHGWKHNAKVCDENVTCFREVLASLDNIETLHAKETGAKRRRVVGVFVGWRGLTLRPPVLRHLSFYGRKRTAHRVGRGRVLEILTRLEDLRNELDERGGRSRLITIGHSFGGALVFEAVSEVLESKLETAAQKRDGPIEGFGDLVVLINPAFEAERYRRIHELAEKVSFDPSTQPAVLVTVTSESDAATRIAFPIGRALSTLFARVQPGATRRALRTAVGHFPPYRTHFLNRGQKGARLLSDVEEPTEARTRGAADCICRYLDPVEPVRDETVRNRETVSAPMSHGISLVSREESFEYGPYLMVQASDEVITKHNGIYNELFVEFLRALVLENERRVHAMSRGGVE